MSTAVWEAVKDSQDKRRVVYWRLGKAGPPQTYIGAVSKQSEGEFRALLYGPDGRVGQCHKGRTELGHYATKATAKMVVERAEETRRVYGS